MNQTRRPTSNVRLSQDLTLGQAIALGLSAILPVLAIALLGPATGAAGVLTPLALLLATLIVTLNNLGYVELSARTPQPGGAYSLVHDATENPTLSFFTGWCQILAQLGLSALLTQVAAHTLGLLVRETLGVTLPPLLYSAVLLGLVVALNFLRRYKRGRGLLTWLLIALLIALVALVILRLEPAAGGPGPANLPLALTILLAAFAGLESLTDHQQELHSPGHNIPRALLFTPLIAGLLGAGLATVLNAFLRPLPIIPPLVALGDALWAPAGGWVVAALSALFALLALNRTLSSGVHSLYVMSWDSFWPEALGQVHKTERIPTRQIVVVGLLALPLTLVPALTLSQVTSLLYLATLMSVNLALASRPKAAPPERESPERQLTVFALPFHPWIPGLTLAVDVLLLSLWGAPALAWAAGLLLVGGAIYFLYGRRHHSRAHQDLTIFRSSARAWQRESMFRVLVPVANPETAETMLRLAGHLAKAQGGEVLALQVVTVPEPIPIEAGRRRARTEHTLLEQALTLGRDEGLPIKTLTRISRTVAHGILETAADAEVDLILMGWRGPHRTRGGALGGVTAHVLRDASSTVLVMQGEREGLPQRILVPTAGGPHARAATDLALSLAEAWGAEVTLLGVQVGSGTPQQIAATHRRLAETLTELDFERPPQQKVITAAHVVEGIVAEAQAYDMVLLGVSEESLVDQLIFGSVPIQVASRVGSTALIQSARGLTGIWRRRFVQTLRDLLPPLSEEERQVLQDEMGRAARPSVNYSVLIVLSCIIAALGLLLNSPAVVIGAMLVAPLMSPIMAFSMGLILGDLRLIRLSIEAIFKGVAMAIIIAAFIGLLSPLQTITGEMLARSRPTLLDLGVALASGMAGAYALARKDVSAALPGVAIAAALMPPLATVGVSLALGDFGVAGGALLLFITNIAAISLAGGLVFLTLGARPQGWEPQSMKQLRKRLAASMVLLLIIAIPLGVIMGGIVRDAAQERAIEAALSDYLAQEDLHLTALEISQAKRNELLVIATVRAPRQVDHEMVVEIAARLGEQLDRPVELEIVSLPSIRSETP
jgi:uncharacterized hydrophobic protein (TIGR00271 family)